MIHLTSAALFFLAAGILTSVSILSVFQILFGIALTYYTYLAIKNKKTKLPKSAYWLIAFTTVAFISLILNFDLIPKPSKNFGRLKYFLFGFAGIYVMQPWLKLASDRSKKIISTTFLVSIIVTGLVSIYQVYIKGDYRADGLTNIMRYGYGSAMLLLTVLSALFHKQKIKNWFDARIGLVAFIIGFAGLYLTLARGGLLAFLCGLPFVIYFYRAKLGLIFGGVCLIGITGLMAFYLLGKGGFESRFLSTKNNNSDVMRRSQWQAALIAIQEKPVLGWGLSNFHTQVKRIKETNNLESKTYNDAHAHNVFLEIAAGTGLIGLFLFLGWLLTWAWEMLKGPKLIGALVIPFGVAFVVGGQFEVTLDANNSSMIFALYAFSLAWKPMGDKTYDV